MPTLDVRRSRTRLHTDIGWLDSRHSFSFGQHYEPDNTHFGLLLVSNDDRIAPTTGFETHPHRDMEIVTWVLDGAIVHQDSEGNNGIITPGLAQRMSAGSGIRHSEKNDGSTGTGTHFVQMWVVPDTERIRPGYAESDVTADLERGGWVPVASGRGHGSSSGAIDIRQRDAVLWAARVQPGGALELPTSRFAHVFLARGAADLEGAGALAEGDAVRITGSQGQRVTAGADGAELLVWEMHSALS